MKPTPGVPSKKQFCDIECLEGYAETCLPGIAALLHTMVCRGDARLGGMPPADDNDAVVFSGTEPPSMSVQDYIIRLFKYGLASPEAYIHMVVYIGRWRERTGQDLHSFNVHRLMLTVFVVAAKLRDDVYYSNAFYAELGGVAQKELSRMERAFLTQCDFDLYVSAEEHAALVDALNRPLCAALEPPATRRKSLVMKKIKDCVACQLRKFRKSSEQHSGSASGHIDESMDVTN